MACRDQRLPWFAARPADQALWRLSPADGAGAATACGRGGAIIEWQGGLRWLQAPMHHREALRTLALQVGGSASCFAAGD